MILKFPTVTQELLIGLHSVTDGVYVVVVVVSHMQRIGYQPEKTTLYGGQSRVWSAEHEKKKKMFLRPTLMHTKNLYENGPNPFFSGFFNLMGTRMVQIRMAKSV